MFIQLSKRIVFFRLSVNLLFSRFLRPVLIVLLDAQGKLTRFADADRIKRWMEATATKTQSMTSSIITHPI